MDRRAPNQHPVWDDLFDFMEARSFHFDDFWNEEMCRTFRWDGGKNPDIYITFECSGAVPSPHVMVVEAYDSNGESESWSGQVRVSCEDGLALLLLLASSFDTIADRATRACNHAAPVE